VCDFFDVVSRPGGTGAGGSGNPPHLPFDREELVELSSLSGVPVSPRLGGGGWFFRASGAGD